MENYFPSVWIALYPRILILVIVMAIDFLLGVIVALVMHEFDWQKLDHFLTSDFLPILGWIAAVLLVCLPVAFLPEGKPVPIFSDVIYGTVFFTMLASVLQSLAKIGVLTKPLEALHIPYTAKLKSK